MSSTIMSQDERMVLSRTFGHINQSTYSPAEYAHTMAPAIARKLQEGPIGVANSLLEPGGRGVNLSIVCERTFTVRPSRRGTPVNEVLYEDGQPLQTDFGKFLGEMFQLAEHLHTITLIDVLGSTHTFSRKDVPLQETAQTLVPGLLDLSVFAEKKHDDDSEEVRIGKEVVAGFLKKKTRESGEGSLDLSMLEAGAANLSPFGAVNERKADPVDVQNQKTAAARKKKGFPPAFRKKTGTEKADIANIRRFQMAAARKAKEKRDKAKERRQDKLRRGESLAESSENLSLDEEVAVFLAEGGADFPGAAGQLLKDSQGGTQPRDLGYGGYLRRTVVGKGCGHLLRHANPEISGGATAARRDVTALAGALR